MISILSSCVKTAFRSFFLLFLGSFLFSFISVYATSRWWFFWYLISAFSCVLYAPNRKALKELLDAWPNIMNRLKGLWNKWDASFSCLASLNKVQISMCEWNHLVKVIAPIFITVSQELLVLKVGFVSRGWRDARWYSNCKQNM